MLREVCPTDSVAIGEPGFAVIPYWVVRYCCLVSLYVTTLILSPLAGGLLNNIVFVIALIVYCDESNLSPLTSTTAFSGLSSVTSLSSVNEDCEPLPTNSWISGTA